MCRMIISPPPTERWVNESQLSILRMLKKGVFKEKSNTLQEVIKELKEHGIDVEIHFRTNNL